MGEARTSCQGQLRTILHKHWIQSTRNSRVLCVPRSDRTRQHSRFAHSACAPTTGARRWACRYCSWWSSSS